MKLPPTTTARLAMMRELRRRRGRRRGVALIMVLGAITVLTVFLTELQESTTADLSAALAERDALQAEYYARSAVHLSRLLIASEPTARSAVPFFNVKQLPIWAHANLVLGPFNGEVGREEFESATQFDLETGENVGFDGKGYFTLKIIEEDSKINANMAAFAKRRELAQQFLGLTAPVQYNPLFENEDADGQHSDRRAICSAIIDWVDDDQDLEACDPDASAPSSGGAEDSFYQVLGLDYQRKNAAFDSLEELRMVRGMGDDFWATFVEPDGGDPEQRVVTVWGLEQVNVNTANAQTLWGLICAHAVPPAPLCEDPEQALSFISSVSMLRSFLPGVPLFTSTKQFVSLMQSGTIKGGLLGPMIATMFQTMGVQPVTFQSAATVEQATTVKSRRFSIYAEGIVPGYRRETRTRIHAVVAFDNTQALGAAASAAAGGPAGGGLNPANTPGSNGSSSTGTATGTGVLSPDDPSQNPGGTVIYWRVE
jgi:general secretion pathway protein K